MTHGNLPNSDYMITIGDCLFDRVVDSLEMNSDIMIYFIIYRLIDRVRKILVPLMKVDKLLKQTND